MKCAMFSPTDSKGRSNNSEALQILTNDDEVENWRLSSFLLAVTNTQYRKINDFILLSFDSFVHFLQIFAISFPIFCFHEKKIEYGYGVHKKICAPKCLWEFFGRKSSIKKLTWYYTYFITHYWCYLPILQILIWFLLSRMYKGQ